MEKIKHIPSNEFSLKLVFDKAYDEDDTLVGVGTRFGIQEEEDNVLHFYYHILDICKDMLNGDLKFYRLPQLDFGDLISDSEKMVINNALTKMIVHLANEVMEYEKFRKEIDKL